MTQEKHRIYSYTEQVELVSVNSLIGSARYPLADDSRVALLQTLDAECGQIIRSVHEQEFAAVRETELAGALAKERLDSGRVALAAAESAEQHARPSGSWVKVVIWALCAAACFAAEFVLSWNALCFVLNVERRTVLGLLLGLAPPSGLAVLEVFLARMFEDPWQRARSGLDDSGRRVAHVAMAVLLIILALGNGAMILCLAKAREEAGKAARVLFDTRSAAAATIDQGAIDRAVLWVSLLVTIDGSVFLLLSLADGARLRQRMLLVRAASHAREKSIRLEDEYSKATAAADSAHERWGSVAAKANLAAERYRTHCRYLIAEKTAAAQRTTPIEELVEQSLRLRISA